MDGKNEQKRIGLFTGTDARDSARDLTAGMISGFVCKIFEYPFDTIKVLQQTGGKDFKGPVDCLKQTYNRGGFFSFYQGLTSPLLGAMAENATLFVAYGAMKKGLDVNPNPTLADPVPMWKYLAAGAGSGICSAFVLTPVELVKCRLQVQQAGAPRVYSGPVDCVIKTVRSDGFQGLWKGNVSCLLREIPGNMAWFGTYEIVKHQVQVRFNYDNMNDVPLAWTAFAGACAGVAYWGVPYPADTVKSKIQTDPKFSGLSFGSALRKIVATEGVGALYNGVAVTCIRAAPSHALIFYFYELSSKMLERL
mmetsp:Transcript_4352/g.6467  ORF Transcript_4352/g.6467 Transcript_4352/m.6467 type:complete len:307 (+) Transcript_4352:306-1226(+)